jgi:threonine dehydrogenase-like Zn-dependent dehydrogenase
MLAFVLDEKGPHMSPDQPEPEPGPDEVVVRVLRAGVCNTDLELARGYMDFNGVLGHEFVGQALDGPLAGKRVVAGINFGCGRCAWCKGGLERHCPSRRVMGILGADGAMAERVAVPSANLRVVPDGIDDDAAVFTEPVAAACEILDQLEAANGLRETRTPALVFGAGKLGPLIAQVLAAAGFDVGLVGRHLDSVEWLADRGITLMDSPPSDRRPLVVEATGSIEGLRAAVAATSPRGTLVLKTTVAGKHQIELAPIVIDEITLLGSRCGRMEAALERLASGEVATAGLIDASYDLREAQSAFERAAARGTRKVLLRGD